MARAPVLWIAAYAAAAAIGWALARPPTDSLVAPIERITVPSFEPEGLQLAMAVGDFRGLGFIAAEAVEAGPPPEPVIDIGVQLRRDLTAVVHHARRPVLWVVEPEAELGRRAVRRGQEFRDGWVFASLSGNDVVLRKSGEERRVPIVGDLPEPVDASATQAPAPGRGGPSEPADAPGR